MSLRHCAYVLSLFTGELISKQAVRKRILSRGPEFMKLLLGHFTSQALGLSARFASAKGSFSHFRRVLIQDSTLIQLPPRLASSFPGCVNQTNTSISILRIQAVLDLISESFVHFGLAPYTRNDQAAASDISQVAQSGDLIIHDLGYFVIKVFRNFSQRGIFFISRLHSRCILIDPQSSQQINLVFWRFIQVPRSSDMSSAEKT